MRLHSIQIRLGLRERDALAESADAGEPRQRSRLRPRRIGVVSAPHIHITGGELKVCGHDPDCDDGGVLHLDRASNDQGIRTEAAPAPIADDVRDWLRDNMFGCHEAAADRRRHHQDVEKSTSHKSATE